MIKKTGFLVLIFFFEAFLSFSATASDSINIIPKPLMLTRNSGQFVLPSHIVIAINSKQTIIENFVSAFGKKVAAAQGIITQLLKIQTTHQPRLTYL